MQDYSQELDQSDKKTYPYTDMWVRGFKLKQGEVTSRPMFWKAFLFHCGALIVLTVNPILGVVYVAASLLPLLMMTMRRLDDAKKPPLLALLMIIPLLGLIPLILCMFPSKSEHTTGSRPIDTAESDDAPDPEVQQSNPERNSNIIDRINALNDDSFNKLCYMMIIAGSMLTEGIELDEKNKHLAVTGASVSTFLAKNFPDRIQRYDEAVEKHGAQAMQLEVFSMDEQLKQELDTLVIDIARAPENLENLYFYLKTHS